MDNKTATPKTALPISRLFPNVITIMAICFGFTSIRYALDSKWDVAVTFIIIAGFLDVADGRLARFLKATSNFGAQLDSLADFVNFGVSPAAVLYLWYLQEINIKGMGWAMVLFYVICSAIRLARFNSDLAIQDRPDWKEGFFTGVPAPAGAYLAVLPIMLNFKFDIIEYVHPILVGIYLIIIALLMSSRIPTFATKKLIIKKEYVSLVLVVTGLVTGVIIMEPWIVLPFLGIIYLISIAFSVRAYNKLAKTK